MVVTIGTALAVTAAAALAAVGSASTAAAAVAASTVNGSTQSRIGTDRLTSVGGLPIPDVADIWTPPLTVNRVVTGGLPIGDWSYDGSGNGLVGGLGGGLGGNLGGSGGSAGSGTSGGGASRAKGGGTPGSAPASAAPGSAGSGVSSGSGVSPAAAGSTPADDAVAVPGLGIQKFYPFQDVTLGEKQSIGVNLANGNLVERDTDLALNGPLIGLHLDRFYNGLSSRVGTFGPKWSISAGADIGLEIGTGAAGGIPAGQVVFRAPSGFRAKFTAVSGSTTAYTSPAGLNADLVKAANGTFTLTYHASSEKLSFTAGGYLTKDAERNGNALTYSYNTDNTLASVQDAAGRVTSFVYYTSGTTNGLLRQITDPAGRLVTFDYDTNGRLFHVTDPRSKKNKYEYDASGRLQYITTYGASVTKVDYDTTGRVTQLTRWLTRSATTGPSTVTTFGYNTSSGASTSTVVTDANSHASTFAIDSSGRKSSATDALGHQRSTSWSTNSDVQTATDASGAASNPSNGKITTFSYDTANNPTAVQTPTGAKSTATYATGGTCGSTDATHPYQAKCATDDAGNRSSYTYDAPGNVLTSKDTSTSGGTGVTTATYTYQGSNGVTCTGAKTGQQCSIKDGRGNTTALAYDSDGNLATVTPPAPLPATSSTYDSMGRLHTHTDGKGATTTYDYDAADHLTQVSLPGSSGGSGGSGVPASTVKNFYTDDGYLYATSETSTSTDTLGYTYDALNRLTGKATSNTSSPLSVTLDGVGNVTSATDPSGTTSYGYNAANQLTSLAQPGGSCPSPTVAANASPKPAPGSRCIRFGMDNNGKRVETDLPATAGPTISTITRDDTGRPTETKTVNAGGTVLDWQRYSYVVPNTSGPTNDRSRMQTRRFNLAAGVPANNLVTYTYDTLGRLTSAVENDAANTTFYASWKYTLDANGNRTQQVRAGTTGQTAQTITYSYDADNELTSINGNASNLAFDANGNETSSRGASDLGMPYRTTTVNDRLQATDVTTTGVGGGGSPATTTYGYAGIGNTTRTEITAPTGSSGATTSLLTGPLGLQQSLDGANSGAATSYTYTPDGSLVGMTAPDGTSYYPTTDYQGDITALVTVAGTTAATYSYGPTGALRASTGGATATTNPYRYQGAAGGYTDTATGLVKLGARYYDPSTGRFTQPDPSGQEANPYLYGGADPINHTDPAGLDATDDSLTTASYVAGLGSGASVEAPPVALAFTAVSIGVSTAQVAYSCSGNGDVSCGDAAIGLGIGVATLGAGYGLNKLGASLASAAVNTIGTSIGAAFGFSTPA